jgi:prolyl oligopeptidase
MPVPIPTICRARISWLVRAVCLLAAGILVAAAGAPPPTALTVDHVETLFGMTFNDPYFWMEAGGPQFDDWISGQADYARRVLDSIPGHAALLAQLRNLDRQETYIGTVVRAGRWWVYSKLRPTDSSAKIFIRPIAGGAERVLIDASEFDAGGLSAHIDYWSVAPDGRHIAYGVSLGGSETGILHDRSIESGADLADLIDRTRYITPSWVDSASFLYTRLPKPIPGKAQALTGGLVYLHRLGSDPATDTEVFGPGEIAGQDIGAHYFFQGLASPGSGQIVGIYDAGLTSSPKAVFVAEKTNSGSTPAWREVARLQDDIRGVVLHGDMLYLRTARDAPHQRIIRTSTTTPDLAHAIAVLAEGAGTIGGMVAAADALYVRYNEGGFDRLVRVPWDSAAEPVATPFEGSITGLTADATSPGAVLTMQGWTHSGTVLAYDPEHRNFVDTGIAPPSPVSFDDVGSIELRAPAADGAMIPLSIIAPRATARDRRHPVLMYAYGAYGATISPSFSALRRAWLDRGGIYVIVHVRGSGGFGNEWYRAGRLGKKTKSISDFIDAADYLVRTGWATPATLSAVGGSAGGIVIGGAVVARPDLFSAAIINVGLVNPLRLEQIPIGPFNTGEFGSTKTEEGVRMLASIDPYHKLRYGISYPGVMVSIKGNDTRIPPWMPGKFAARLQAATTGPRPILLRVDPTGGHSFETKEQVETALADTYAFLLWQAGVSEFQPSP